MKYFFLQYQYKDAGFIDGDVTFEPPLSDHYYLGKTDVSNVRNVNVILDTRVKRLRADFFHTGSGAFFCSVAFAEVLSLLQSDVNFVSAKTSYHRLESTEKKYKLIHVNQKIDCFDYERSEYAGKALVLENRADPKQSPRLVKGVTKSCIDEERAAGAHYFFLDHVTIFNPVVSQDFVAALVAAKLKVEYTPVEI